MEVSIMEEYEKRSAGRSEIWGEDESRVFVEYGRAMVPGREEIERTILGLIPAEPDEPFLEVEIGTGAGWLSAAVLREFSRARILGLDGSPEMLETAATLLTPYGERVELRRFRLEEPSWTDCRRRGSS
jgi:methylase of polypeptide subunit release factors